MSVTGYAWANLPEGPERDEALGLIRIGLKFSAQQCGRRPDTITQYLTFLVRELPRPCAFAALLQKLEGETQRHDCAAHECVCTAINRVHQLATFWHPRRGQEVEITFPSLVVKMSRLKKSPINTKPK